MPDLALLRIKWKINRLNYVVVFIIIIELIAAHANNQKLKYNFKYNIQKEYQNMYPTIMTVLMLGLCGQQYILKKYL